MPISPLESMIKHGGRPTLEQNIADIGKAVIRGTSVVPESLSGIVKMGEDITGLQGTWDDRLAQVAERLRQRFAPSPSLQEGGFKYRPVMSLLSGIGESTPYTLGTAGAGALVSAATRSLLAGLLTQMGLVGGLASGQTYKEAREAGTKPSKAGLLAGLRGIGEAGLEFAPAETFLARLFGKGKGGLGRAILEQSLAEGITEPAQQVWENLLAKAYDPNRPLMQGVPESAIIGGAMGGLMGGGAHLFSGATPSLVEATPQPETDLMRDKDLIIEETPIEEVRALPYYPLMLPKGKTPASDKVIPLPPPPETKLVSKKPIVLPAPSKSEVATKKITRDIIQQNPDVIFVFGDNDLRRGKGGQAYSARGEKNVLGIRTKKKPATTEDSYYTDKEFEQNKKKIIEDVLRVKRAIDEGKKVYLFPKIGEGRAELQRRAPKTYAFLKKALDTLKKYAAQKGALVTSLEEKVTSVPTKTMPMRYGITAEDASGRAKEFLQKNFKAGQRVPLTVLMEKGLRTATTRADKGYYKVGDIVNIGGKKYRIKSIEKPDFSTPEGIRKWEEREGWSFEAIKRKYPSIYKQITNPQARQFVLEPVREKSSTLKRGFTLSVTPEPDKVKGPFKASLATAYIGFGKRDSSTYRYALDAKKQGIPVNKGKYSPDDVVFASINGQPSRAALLKTFQEVKKALDAGATVLTDSDTYLAKSSYNQGEKMLARMLRKAGYEATPHPDNTLVNVWRRGKPKKLLPAKTKTFTLPTTKTVIREVESPIYRKKTPREVYRLKLKPSGEEILFEIVRPSQQLPTEETIAPQKRIRESYREKKLAPEENDYRWLQVRQLAHILQGENISRDNLIHILENMGWEGDAAESVADKILAGEVKPLDPEKFQQIYDFKQKKRLEAPTAVRFNVYTKDGDLIYTGYGTPRKIQQAMREIATEASRGVKFQDIMNKVKEEFPSPEETTTLTPQEAIKKMLLGEITTPEAILALTRHGYTRGQAETTVNAAWEKYASTKPFIQAKDLQAYIKKMQDEGIDKNEAVKLWITRRAMEEGMSEAEYARKVINEALQKPKVTSQLAYIRKNLFPDLSRDDWKAIRQQAVLNNLIDSQPHLFSREDTLEDIKRKIEENVKGIPKQEREKLAKQLYNLKESIIPYDDEVALTSDLVEDLFYKSALYEAFPKHGEGARRLFRLLEDESGEIKFAPEDFDSLFDKVKLLSTAVPVLEAAGPETAALVQDARDMYEGMAMGYSQITQYHRKYSDLMKSLPKYAQEKLSQWFKRNYDRTNTDRATLRKEFHTFLSRNPAIPKEKALKLFDLIRDMNDLLNLFYSEIESLYDNDLLFKINIIDPDAIRLPNGEVISRGTARVKVGTKVLAQSTPVVQAEIQYFTQQGIRKQYITLKKEGDWFKELEKIARKRLQTELRPWVNYIPHYREVKVGWYWAIIRDNTIKKGNKTIFAKAYPNKETALKEAIKEAKRRGLDPESKEVEIEIKQHQENPDSIPIDVLPIEVEGWLARLGIDPDSDEARRIVNDLKKRSGFYSHFIRSRNIDGWMDTLDGFLRGFIQSFNSAMFTYQRLYAKKYMLEKLRKIEKNENYSKTIKGLAKKFVESYTEFEKLGKFSRALLKTRAFLYIYALQNKATYVLQNITEWIHSIPAVIDALQERGISEAKAIPIALKAFARVFKSPSPEIKALEAKARRNGLTDYKTWLKYELHPDAMDTLLEFLADLDVLGKESEKFSSQVTFRVGLEVAKEIGLKGDAAYKFARDFLLGKGKIFMTKGNKIGAYLIANPAVSRVLYPVFTTVVADILGRVFVAPKISKTLLFLLMYGLLAGVEGLPFVNKKKFSEINSPLEVIWRKGILGLAGIDTGFLSLNPFFRAKFYLSDRPYQTMQKAFDLLKSAFQVASIGAFIDSITRAARIADKYDLSLGMFALISTPLGGLQHIIKGLLRATYGERVYNKYRKQYKDLGWRPSTLKDYIYEALDIPTSGRFDAWQRYKKGAKYRHRLWVIKHGGERWKR